MDFSRGFHDRVFHDAVSRQREKNKRERANERIRERLDKEGPEALLRSMKKQMNAATPEASKPGKSTAHCGGCGCPIVKPEVVLKLQEDQSKKGVELHGLVTSAACRCEGDDIEAYQRRYARFIGGKVTTPAHEEHLGKENLEAIGNAHLAAGAKAAFDPGEESTAVMVGPGYAYQGKDFDDIRRQIQEERADHISDEMKRKAMKMKQRSLGAADMTEQEFHQAMHDLGDIAMSGHVKKAAEQLQRLAEEQEPDAPFVGKKNVYTCDECGHQKVTVDLVHGTTPFMISCGADGCGAMSKSSFYRVDQSLEPTHEWYRPEDVSGETEMTKEHVRKGGLLLRVIEDAKEF